MEDRASEDDVGTFKNAKSNNENEDNLIDPTPVPPVPVRQFEECDIHSNEKEVNGDLNLSSSPCDDYERNGDLPEEASLPTNEESEGLSSVLLGTENQVVRRRKNVSVAEYTRNLDVKNSSKNRSSKKVKARKIQKCLTSDCNLETLKQLAISQDGLINDDLRKRTWPILLGVDVENIPQKPDKNVLQGHRDYEQVVLDVNRSLKRFPPGMDEDVRLSLQDQLVDCIMRVLVLKNELHYYQGYHDIVVTFLLVVGEDVTVALMHQLSMKHLRDFMYENMEKTSSMLHYLYPLIGRYNIKVKNFMEKAEVGTMFCLPWLITWYGHVLNDIKDIVRLYDFFIACHPLMPIYLAAAIVLFRADAILNCEPEMPFIHCLLSNIPDDLPFEDLICRAGDLFVQYPPQDIEKEARQQYESAELENRKRQERINLLKQKKLQKQNSFWPFTWKNYNVSAKSPERKSSILVKVTVWTSAALLSAAAMTLLNTYYVNAKSVDNWIDVPWMWGGK